MSDTEKKRILKDLFLRGSFRDILAATIDETESVSVRNGLAYLIGALTFTGRVDDALTLFKNASHWTNEDLALCRFVLGIGLVRVSRYEAGREFILAGLLAARKKRKNADDMGVIQFYAFQGAAIYRYFQCRYLSALSLAKKAWAASFAQNFRYGQILAADLRGHCLLRTGEISAGLKSLKESERLAKAAGNGALLDNIRSSVVWYRSCYGLDGSESIDDLRLTIRKMDPQDNFSLASAQVELGRRLSLAGNLDDSEKFLEAGARIILESGHRRQKANLLHRFAWNRLLKGKTAEAIEYLDRSDVLLDAAFDLQHQLANAGLRLKILSQSSALDADLAVLRKKVQELTRRTGSGIGRNILWREFGEGEPTLKGDDPLGDLCHHWSASENSTYSDLARIIDSGLFGFLNYVLPYPKGTRAIVLGLIPGELFLLDAGSAFRSSQSISAIMKSLILLLGRGKQTKQELVETLWGYRYLGLRHDPMVYALINRLRRALKNREYWLVADSGGYALAEGVSIFVYETSDQVYRTSRMSDDAEEYGAGVSIPKTSTVSTGLNHRQLVILSELEQRRFINAADCVALFKVSRITAARDLGELTEQQLLTRIGRARATQYTLNRNEKASAR